MSKVFLKEKTNLIAFLTGKAASHGLTNYDTVIAEWVYSKPVQKLITDLTDAVSDGGDKGWDIDQVKYVILNRLLQDFQNNLPEATRDRVKVIFLDVDGVLNKLSNLPSSRNTWNVEDSCVRCLKRILDNTGGKIVLSSSWRKIEPAKASMMGAFKRHGIDDRVIGQTPVLERSFTRNDEIIAWLCTFGKNTSRVVGYTAPSSPASSVHMRNSSHSLMDSDSDSDCDSGSGLTNPVLIPGEGSRCVVAGLVCIDDADLLLHHGRGHVFRNHFVKTNVSTGLTMSDCEQVINILNTQNSSTVKEWALRNRLDLALSARQSGLQLLPMTPKMSLSPSTSTSFNYDPLPHDLLLDGGIRQSDSRDDSAEFDLVRKENGTMSLQINLTVERQSQDVEEVRQSQDVEGGRRSQDVEGDSRIGSDSHIDCPDISSLK